MALQNNKRIQRRRDREILKRYGNRQDITKSDIPNVENMEMTEVDPSTLSEGQFVPNQFETVEESSNETGLQPQQTIPLSVETLGTQTGKNIGTMFNELAQQNQEPTNPYDIARQTIMESVGEEPTLDESQLKRAKTQALVNAFGNLLQAGVGFGTMQGGGYFQAKPIDNTQVLANLEGVYDKYYKEMADYRDDKSKSKLALANLDLQQFEKETQRAIDKEKQDVIASNRAEDVEFREKELQYRIDTKDDELKFKRDEADRKYELQKDQLKQNAQRLNLDIEKFTEAQLQSDRQLGAIYEKADRDERIAMEGFILKREELDQIIRRNDNSDITNGINLTTKGFESLNDAFVDMNYVKANTTLNSYVELDGQVKDLKGNTIEGDDLADYETSKKYVNEYNKLLNTQNQLIERMNMQKQAQEGVDVSDPSKVDIKDDKIMKALSSDVEKEFVNTSPEFNNKMFGEGKGLKGKLNATNIDFAINYLENKDNFLDIQQGFGWKDDEAESKRQDLVVKLIILQKRAEAIEKGTSSTE